MFRLDERVAVVTGAGGGIGAATAAVLAEAGATVVLADINADQAAQQAATLSAQGLRVEALALDVSNRAAVVAAVDAVVERHGRLDIMVNNAAVIDDCSPLNVTEEELDRVHEINFKGVVFGSQAAARHMVAAGRGCIVNVTSGVVDVATPTVVGYSTSKAAAAQYTRGLAMELAAHGVRVNAIAPGWTDTPMNERHVLRDDGSIDPDRKAAYVAMRAASAPLGIAGEPADQALAVLYLVSDAAKFVTGAVLRANGGATMPW